MTAAVLRLFAEIIYWKQMSSAMTETLQTETAALQHAKQKHLQIQKITIIKKTARMLVSIGIIIVAMNCHMCRHSQKIITTKKTANQLASTGTMTAAMQIHNQKSLFAEIAPWNRTSSAMTETLQVETAALQPARQSKLREMAQELWA